MRNEERAFKYQPEENGSVMAPVEVVGKKSAEIIQLDDFRSGKKKRGDYVIDREYNVQRKIFDFLKNENILIETSGYKVFDFEKFSEFLFLMKEKPRNITIAQGKQVHLSKSAIFEALRDLNVVAKNEYLYAIKELREIKEKPLFNVPESVDDAFNTEGIRTKDYYLNYWDIFGSANAKQVNWNNKLISRNSEEINMREFAFATKLFKDFQARRSSEGEFQVYDKAKGKYIKFGIDWAHENLGGFGSHEFETSAHNFLLTNCSNMLEKGLIKLGDIQTKTDSASGRLLRSEKFVSGRKPEVMISGVKYYIGRDNFNFQGESIPTENIKIVVLDKNTAGVVLINGGQEKVYCLIDLLSPDEKEKKKMKLGVRQIVHLRKKR